jgi:rSAM/selenodomain-associated transferase 1
MSGGIAIFVKTPGRTPLKTRLAADIGRELAEQWHARAAGAVAAVAREACRGGGAEAYWAVAEPDALNDPRWSGLPALAQCEGSLGARMHHVQLALLAKHRAAVLVGADTPQIDADLLRRALRWLDAQPSRLVLGPADDGGFWLVGTNRPVPLALWESVAYSQPQTAADFVDTFSGWGDWLQLPCIGDVDTVADLAACRLGLAALVAPLPAQRSLLQWMDEQLPKDVPAP